MNLTSSTSSGSLVAPIDSCSWVGGERCGQPRSCRACLNTAVPSGDTCAVGPHGECMVSQQLQQQLQQSKYGSQSKFYVAGDASYCSLDDAACQTCTRQWLDTAARDKFVSTAALCVGADGCLCLASCELPTWEESVRTALCADNTNGKSTANANDYDKISSGDPSTHRMLVVSSASLALVVTFTLISLGLSRLVRKIDDHGQQSRLNRLRLPVRVPTGPQLQLEGWTAMRERLVEEGSGDPAPTLAPIVVAGAASVDGADPGDKLPSRLQIWW